MSRIVFAGPSLHGSMRAPPHGVELRPPAVLGDVTRAVDDGATVIGLIDGRFETILPVWHKELLWALEKGIAVLGAASMGALRAAELAPFGMRGIGSIYAAFAKGELDADDEVAILHGPAETGFMPLSTALVDIRATLAAAEVAAIVDAATADRLITGAKRLFYKERTWSAVLTTGVEATAPAALAALAHWLPQGRIDAKRRDAEELLDVVAEIGAGSAAPGWCAERPRMVVDLVREAGRGPAATPALLDRLRLEPGAYAKAGREALLRLLALAETSRRRLELDPGPAMDRLRERHGLHGGAAFRAWCAARELGPVGLEASLRADAAIEQLIERSSNEIDAAIVERLRLEPDFTNRREAAARGAEEVEAAARAGQAPPEPAQLLAWYCAQRHIKAPPSPGTLARELGFASTAALYAALHAAWLAREGRDHG